MMPIRRWIARLAALVAARRLDRELDGEVLAHLELAERDALARGLSPEAARREARLAFGAVEPMKERHRDARSARWLEHLVRDIRYGLASLRRDPLFALVAVGVLAVGIGANTATFSIVDGVVLKPMPFPEPDRIVRVWEAPTPTSTNSTTTRTFLEFARRSQTFAAMSAESLSTATVNINGVPTRWNGRYVSFDHFDVFGVQPMIGRGFRAEEDVPGADRVVVISHAAWQQAFGGDPSILNREILLDDDPHRIIGVLPPGAFDRDRGRPQDDVASFWRLNAFTREEVAAPHHWLNPVGRLKPGVTIEQAREDVAAVRAQIADLIPAWKRDWATAVEPYDQRLIGDRLRQSLYVALGAVMMVLLIACANVANLLLARGAGRRKEIAVRAALGASRARIAAQLLTESLVLGLAGGAAGVGLAALLLQAAAPLLPLAIPYTADIALNVRVLLFAIAAALAVSMLVGVLPALRLSKASVAAGLASASRGSSGAHDRVRRLIVGAEVAVSLVLICGSVLLVKSLLRLQQVDIGVRAENVITMSVDLSRERYPTRPHLTAFYRAVVDRLEATPGIESASVSGDIPLEGTGGEYLQLPGRSARLLIRFKRVDPGYFNTMGIALAAGRGFTVDDHADAPKVTVINEALARQIETAFGVKVGVGALVDLPVLGAGVAVRVPMLIAGIIRNERIDGDLRRDQDVVAYVPLAQAPRLQVKLSARTRGEPVSAVPAIREAVRALDPMLALADIKTMEQVRQRSLSGLKEPAWLIASFAVVSALLAALGLYGLVSHTVSEQRREIGIRIALGAAAGDVRTLVVRNVMIMIAAGLGIGVAGAAALTRVTRSLLFEVSAMDPSAFVIAAAIMAGVGLAACLVPAWRATRVDPVTALRTE
jgi:putative ABC transport system permease protein